MKGCVSVQSRFALEYYGHEINTTNFLKMLNAYDRHLKMI